MIIQGRRLREMVQTHSKISAQENRSPKGVYHTMVIDTDDVFILDDYDEHDDKIWKEVIDSEELVRILLERNADHLRQSTSDGTPFASGPLKELFGLYGTNEVADKILAGTLDIASLKLSD